MSISGVGSGLFALLAATRTARRLLLTAAGSELVIAAGVHAPAFAVSAVPIP